MRPLTDDEMKVLFEKLANYMGKNIEHLINRPDEKFCFRLHKDRVYYVRCDDIIHATSWGSFIAAKNRCFLQCFFCP